MAKYNTFVVCLCKSGRALLVTSSARKAVRMLEKGKRIEVWNDNNRQRSITWKNRKQISAYIAAEKEWIGRKQMAADVRNSVRRILRT